MSLWKKNVVSANDSFPWKCSMSAETGLVGDNPFVRVVRSNGNGSIIRNRLNSTEHEKGVGITPIVLKSVSITSNDTRHISMSLVLKTRLGMLCELVNFNDSLVKYVGRGLRCIILIILNH